jgi:mRNA interferase MazF
MVDKAMSIKRGRIGQHFGRLDEETLLSVNRSLTVFLGLA